MTIFMRVGPFYFAPRLVPTLAAVVMVALMAWVGTWQSRRAEEKLARQALLEQRLAETPLTLTGSVPSAEPLLYRRVRARGAWIAQGQIFIDNQVSGSRAGFHVVTPLRIEGTTDAVLVNRGWIARTAAYPKAPEVPVPEGTVEVRGLATLPPRRVLELSAETVSGNVWQNLSIERYAQRMRVLPIVVLSEPPAPGLQAVTEKPDAGVDKHREYEMTWFSLCATVIVLWIVLNTRRAR
jgi:surfeit locus 1 family protein